MQREARLTCMLVGMGFSRKLSRDTKPREKKDGKEGPCIFLLTHSLSLGLSLLSLDTVPACAQLKDHKNINAKVI